MINKDPSRQFAASRPSTGDLDSDEENPSRTLIICIDRDDDIGVKAGIKTPIVGKDACLNAATRLAIVDPEEADANAIFAAVKEYDNLMSKGDICEVIVVSGVYERGVIGDRKIRSQVSETLKGFPCDGAIIVSDGVEGEELVPVLQTLVPIVALRNVVIKHSRSVEESYAVLGRYFRMLLFDSRYSKYALGIPGLIFIGIVLIYIVDKSAAALVLPILIGIVFIVRGFDIDRRIESLKDLSAAGYLRLFSAVASVLIILVGLATGIGVFFQSCATSNSGPCQIAAQIAKNPQSIVFLSPKITGYFIINAELYIWLGLAVYITTSIFFGILRPRARHVARNVVELSVLALLYFPVSIFASTLVSQGRNSDLFVAIVMFALAVNFTIAAYLYRYLNARRHEAHAIES
ncbi:MAG: DUF373 family protein [Nitrososphaerota archaeon]|nr:DUF373 family protein [Nitrososphaerota archaeon]